MKYLKRFNEELRSSTYQSAADKLKSIGHGRRSSRLSEWSMKKKQSENLEKWKANVEKYSKFGKFTFNISGKPTNYIQLLVTDEFYVRIDFDDATFAEDILDKRADQYIQDGAEEEVDIGGWVIPEEGDIEEPEPEDDDSDGGSNNPIDWYNIAQRKSKETQSKFPYEWITHLNLAIALIPVDEKSVNKCKLELEEKSAGFLKPDFYNGSYWSNWISFEIKASGENISVSPMTIISYDTKQLGYVNIDDRRSAGLFKNLLIGIFNGSIKYPSGFPEGVTQGGWTSIPDMGELLETTVCNKSDLSSEYGLSMEHFVEALRKTPTNSLFKEVES